MDSEEFLRGFPAVFESPAMKNIIRLAEKVAPIDVSVLLVGETGVGKEVVANIIHGLSERRAHPPVKVNCATVPKELAESLFFGAVKGSYTGSIGDTAGYFREADKSTIFLDELPEMPYEMQTKLLRVLEDKKFRPVGAKADVASDFRIIWASNTPIEEAIKERKLREDLYYRINEFTLHIPPLRERTEDIVPLANFFFGQAVKKSKKEIRGFSKDVLERFGCSDWPGNVRQLRRVVRTAVFMCEGDTIEDRDIDMHVETGGGLSRLEAVERKEIIKTLQETGNDKTQTAAALGIGRQTVYNKIKKYGIPGYIREQSNGETPETTRAGSNGNGHGFIIRDHAPGSTGVRRKMTAEEILRGEDTLVFDHQTISQREYVRLNEMVIAAIEASPKNAQRVAQHLKTSVERLRDVISVFEIDTNMRAAFPNQLLRVPETKRLTYPQGDIIDTRVISAKPAKVIDVRVIGAKPAKQRQT
jgi:transcriptional regulator with AAA-type ATPase domain